jgi:hypothetical protein
MQLRSDAPTRSVHDIEGGDFIQVIGEWYQVTTVTFGLPVERPKSWSINTVGGQTFDMWQIHRYQKAEDFELVTKTGRVLTDEDIQAFADEAEAGYEVPPVGAIVVDIYELRKALAEWMITGAAKNPDGSPALWTMGEPAAVYAYDQAKNRLRDLTLLMMGIDPVE